MAAEMVMAVSALLYLLVLAGIGIYARRSSDKTAEDYFMASRTFGPLILFFAVFGATVSSGSMLGLAGYAYRFGVGSLGYFANISPLAAPLLFLTIGYRFWRIARKHGHITPGEIINHRYRTKHLGTALAVILILWTIPYLMIGVEGAGIIFDVLSQGTIPRWMGAAFVTSVVFIYVVLGGMRGTTWTNVFQGVVMLLFLIGGALYLGFRLGGFEAAIQASYAAAPDKFSRAAQGLFTTKEWFAFMLANSISFIMYPWVFVRLLTGSSDLSVKKMSTMFPWVYFLIYIPAIFIGLWGIAQVPGLAAANTDRVFPMMMLDLAPAWVLGVMLVAILSAVMSTLDAQALTLSSFLTEDFLGRYMDLDERREVLAARGFVGLLLLVALILGVYTPRNIIELAVIAAEGVGLTVYPMVVGLYWRRATAKGVWAGLIWGFVGVFAFQFGLLPSAWTFGFGPFLPMFLTQIPIIHGVSYLTETPDPDHVADYFEEIEGFW